MKKLANKGTPLLQQFAEMFCRQSETLWMRYCRVSSSWRAGFSLHCFTELGNLLSYLQENERSLQLNELTSSEAVLHTMLLAYMLMLVYCCDRYTKDLHKQCMNTWRIWDTFVFASVHFVWLSSVRLNDHCCFQEPNTLHPFILMQLASYRLWYCTNLTD